MTEKSPTAKMLLFAYLDERIEWGELTRWAEDLGVSLNEIINLEEDQAPTRRAGLKALCPSPGNSAGVTDGIAFAYANDWIGFDDVVRWGEDHEIEEDDLLLILEACARAGHAIPAADPIDYAA
jgi:hypothetical protein